MKRTLFFVGSSVLVLFCSVALGLGQVYTLYVDPSDSNAYPTVQAAVDAVPDNSLDAYVIEIAPGNYHELVDISDTKQFITLRGLGPDPAATYIYWATRSDRRGVLRIYGYNIRCENLTVENTTPHGTGQAEALETFGDKAAFENCRFISYQDTYRCQGSGAKRSYLHNCYIAGRTDFIWHKGVALFEDCNIMSTYSNTGGYITAAGTPWEQRWGFIFKNCKLLNDSGGVKVALGRPWRDGAMTTYFECWMDGHISGFGWKDWNGRIIDGLVRYYEYNCTGPGSIPGPHGRLPNTYELTDAEAAEYTRENILAGWNPNITEMPTFWNSTMGYWHQAARWQNGVPSSNSNAYIPTDSKVVVRHRAEASTVTLDGTAKLYVDGRQSLLAPPGLAMNEKNRKRWQHGKHYHRGHPSLTVDELACRSTTAEVHIVNYGTFNPTGWTGFKEPAGVLYIEKGAFTTPNARCPRIVLAPESSDDATITIRSGDDWYVEQIQTGSGTCTIDICGGLFTSKLGLDFGSAATGTLKVTGGDASINITGFYQQGAFGTLAAENEDGAISTINVDGDVVFATGAKLLLTAASDAPADEYVLMRWAGARTGTLTLDESVDPAEWSFEFDDSNKQLRVRYAPWSE